VSQITADPSLLQGGYLQEVQEDASVHNPPAGIRGPMLAIIFFCTGLISYWGNASIATQLGYLSQGIVGLLGVMIVISIFASRVPVVFTREMLMASGFCAWALLGYPGASQHQVASDGLKTLLKLLPMAFVVANAVNGRRTFLWLVTAVVVTTIAASLGGASGLARGVEVATDAGGREQRIQGLFGNPNGLGKLCCLALWSGASLLLISRSKLARVILIAGLGFIVVTIGLTGSRQAMIGLFLLIVALYWYVLRRISTRPGGKVVWAIVIGGVLAAAILYMSTTPFWKRMETMLGTASSSRMESSAGARAAFMRKSLEVALHNPMLGVGYDCVSYELGRLGGSSLRSPHNTFLGLAANTGFIGWGLFYGGWLLLLMRIRTVSRLPLPRVDFVLVRCLCLLQVLLLFWGVAATLVNYKLFWVVSAASLGYLVWLERTYRPWVQETYEAPAYTPVPAY